VFRKASPDAIDLIAALLEYTPTQRLSAIEAMCQPFFDELRDPNCRFPDSRHPNGVSKELPELFNFSKHGKDVSFLPIFIANLTVRAINCPGAEQSPCSISGSQNLEEQGH
jgi:serine/threonine protein kinase